MVRVGGCEERRAGHASAVVIQQDHLRVELGQTLVSDGGALVIPQGRSRVELGQTLVSDGGALVIPQGHLRMV